MPNFVHATIVPYSTNQIFALVKDISAYSEFIPGCISSRVLQQNGTGVVAEISIRAGGIAQSFTTHNILTENKSIVIFLVEGPFNSFSGTWRFLPLSDGVSKVQLHLDFECKSKLLELACGCFQKEMAKSIVMAFKCRAKKGLLYINADGSCFSKPLILLASNFLKVYEFSLN